MPSPDGAGKPPALEISIADREAIMRAQLEKMASSRVVQSVNPSLHLCRTIALVALKPEPKKSIDDLIAMGSVAELVAAIKGHRRYECAGTLPLVGRSRKELCEFLAGLEPYRTAPKMVLEGEEFKVAARFLNLKLEKERLQAKQAELARRAAIKKEEVKAPEYSWALPGTTRAPKEAKREKSEEDLKREREAYQRQYWKMTDAEALRFARSIYASAKL